MSYKLRTYGIVIVGLFYNKIGVSPRVGIMSFATYGER